MVANVEWTRTNGVLVARISGRIDSSNAADVQSALDAEIGEEDNALLLDFVNLDFISSAGLRVSLATAKKLKEAGKEFGVCALEGPVQEVMNVSGFGQIIALYKTVSEGINTMGQEPQNDSTGLSLKRSVDLDIVRDNVNDIALFTLEKYEFGNDTTIPADQREAAIAQIKEVLWQQVEALRKQRQQVLANMFDTAAKTLENALKQ